jgi:hypothetical protein
MKGFGKNAAAMRAIPSDHRRTTNSRGASSPIPRPISFTAWSSGMSRSLLI